MKIHIDMFSPFENFYLACRVLLLKDHSAAGLELDKAFQTGKPDLLQFIRLCSNHLVLPVIYDNLKNNGLTGHFPPDLVTHLDEIYTLNVERNRKILQQIDEINHLLARHGIEPVYLKGTAHLLDNLYSGLGERLIGDIDFLVHDSVYLKTVELLKESGYHTEQLVFDDVTTIMHFPGLVKSSSPAAVEIHRVPVLLKYASHFNTELIFRHRKKIESLENCFVPCDEHKIIHNFIHSQLSDSGFKYKTASLRDLYDLYLLAKRVEPDNVIPQIEEKAKARQYFGFARMVFTSTHTPGTMKPKKTDNRFYRQFFWFSNHPKHHRMYIICLKVVEIFIERPIIKIRNAILTRSGRKALWRRIKDPRWYKVIYSGIKDIFSK